MPTPTTALLTRVSEFENTDPVAAFESLRRKTGFAFFWRGRDDEDLWMGFGIAAPYETFDESRTELNRISATGLPFPPRVFCAIPFQREGNARDPWAAFAISPLILPRILARCRDGKASMVTIQPEQDKTTATEQSGMLEAMWSAKPTPVSETNAVRVLPRTQLGAWRRWVDAALREMESGDLKKVVLSRTVSAFADQPFDVRSILTELLRQDGSSVFALQCGDSVFLGASPERLFLLDVKTLSTESLAGTRPRGRTEREDKRLAGALLDSEKERLEHGIVRDFIVSQLKQLCADYQIGKPAVRKLSAVQHLYTPLEGTLRESVVVDDVLHALHPTPAVCGEPRDAARELIERLEMIPRGLYTGAMGWAEADRAQVAVAIRCALLRDKHALLFAGAGIVPGSDADAEWEETENKLKTLLPALGSLES